VDRKSSRSTGGRAALVLLLVIASLPGLARAQDDAELARKTQNPVADLISVPFQNNLNFGVGPGDDLQYILGQGSTRGSRTMPWGESGKHHDPVGKERTS
jgi:hypothetical protein